MLDFKNLFIFFSKFLDFNLSTREFQDIKACRRFKKDSVLFETTSTFYNVNN